MKSLMKIQIIIRNNETRIILKKGNKLLDAVSFAEKNNLSEKLLPAIDKLLRRNKISPGDIKRTALKTDIKESYTTQRIAAAVAKTYNFAVDNLLKSGQS